MNTPVVKCENVSIGYNGKEIISDISFELERGSYLCIVGENGSGKTTLMKSLLGLIKPYKGNIAVTEPQTGYLPQQTGTQRDFPVTVNEIILSGCIARHSRFRFFYTREDRKLADAMAKKLEIDNIQNKCYQELSGGQQQRVLIARALCAAGNLLILDEPASGLDPIITNEIYAVIDKLNKEDNMTVIMVTHDIRSSLKYASHILHIASDKAYFFTAEEYTGSAIAKSLLRGDVNE